MFSSAVTPAIGALILAALLAIALHWLLWRVLERVGRRKAPPFYMTLIQGVRRSTRWAALAVALLLAYPAVALPAGPDQVLGEVLTLLTIAVVGWILIDLSVVATRVAASRWNVGVADNLRARTIMTRATVVQRIAVVLILVITASVMLMTFPQARALGASLLASAGIVGLIAGLAAQPLLTNIIAGLQIALTQPIRIDDVVVVNGDWGVVEEIDVAFVVIRVWDLRRLIVPLSYFLQNPVENWTYKSANLLGYIHIYADYEVPVGEVRGELRRILEATDLWDGQVWNLQVTQMDERAVQMRALFSARDSSSRWNLMVLVREELLRFLQGAYPERLPRVRVELAPGRQG